MDQTPLTCVNILPHLPMTPIYSSVFAKHILYNMSVLVFKCWCVFAIPQSGFFVLFCTVLRVPWLNAFLLILKLDREVKAAAPKHISRWQCNSSPDLSDSALREWLFLTFDYQFAACMIQFGKWLCLTRRLVASKQDIGCFAMLCHNHKNYCFWNT